MIADKGMAALIKQLDRPCIACGHSPYIAIPTEFDDAGAVAWSNLCWDCYSRLISFRKERAAISEAKALARDLAVFIERVTE